MKGMIRKNILSISMAVIIMVLSLANADKFQKINTINIQGLDKMAHFVMYFVFMSVILFENRNRITGRSQIFIIALIPFIFGIIMELLQSCITVSRSGSIYDQLFNLSGIIASILIFLVLRSGNKEKIK